MRILQAHNYYQIAGGEDIVVAQEKDLLESHGHTVISYTKSNESINSFTFFQKIEQLKKTTWSEDTVNEVVGVLREKRIDICHVHNFFPLISPSIYLACKKMNVPVVQTLHNYRLICTNGLFMRQGKICEDCLGKSPYGAVLKRCYRDSMLQTYAVARMLDKNTKNGTWQHVDKFLCLTQMAKSKFIAHGFPEEKLEVKPNFVEVESNQEPLPKENYLVYAGRLSKTKGVDILIKLAERLDCSIKVVGNGEEFENLNNKAGLELLGKKSHQETLEIIQKAKALLYPSLLYEGMPMTIIESFALKTPVIASNLGAMKSMITDGVNGLLFETENVEDLHEKIEICLNNSQKSEELAENAFKDYNEHYTPHANYKQLLRVYDRLVQKQSIE